MHIHTIMYTHIYIYRERERYTHTIYKTSYSLGGQPSSGGPRPGRAPPLAWPPAPIILLLLLILILILLLIIINNNNIMILIIIIMITIIIIMMTKIGAAVTIKVVRVIAVVVTPMFIE